MLSSMATITETSCVHCGETDRADASGCSACGAVIARPVAGGAGAVAEEARAEALGQRVDLEGERLLIGTSSPEVLGGGDTALVLEPSRGGHEVVAQVDAPVPGSRFAITRPDPSRMAFLDTARE